MCYILYGALHGNINADEYREIENKYEFKFRLGTKHNVKMSAKNTDDKFRVTDWCCDCDSDIGKEDVNAQTLKEYEILFNEIRNIKGAKHIYLSKTWTGKRNKREIELNLNEIDIKNVLANLESDCLYTFII